MSDKLTRSDPKKHNISRRDFLKLGAASLLGIAATSLNIEGLNIAPTSNILSENAFSTELVGHKVIPTETNDATKITTSYSSGVILKDIVNKSVLPEYHEMLGNAVVDIRWIKNNNNQETAILTFIKGGACVIGYDNNDGPFIFELDSNVTPIDMDALDHHIIYSKNVYPSGEIIEEYRQYRSRTSFTIDPPLYFLEKEFDNHLYDVSANPGRYIVSEARLIHNNGQLFLVDTVQPYAVKIKKYDHDSVVFTPIIQCESLDTMWNIVNDKPMPFVAGINQKDVGIFTTLDNVPDSENNSRNLFFVIADKSGVLSVTETKHSNIIKATVEQGDASVEFISDKGRIKRIAEKSNIKLSGNEQIIIVKIVINGSIHEIPWLTINETVTDIYEVKELLAIDQYKDFFNPPPTLKQTSSQTT